jgi:CRP-like cAMP-binding protein
MSGSLRELGLDLVAEGNWERALAVFAEAVHRRPEDHRSRLLAARCFGKLGETERAVAVLHACAEGLLRRDYLLSAIAACRQAQLFAPREKRIRETLERVHARAARSIVTRAAVPPPLPPEALYDGHADSDLMTLQGSALMAQALSVLGLPDPGGHPAPDARPPLPLFADLSRDAFVALIDELDYRELGEGETLCREGDEGDRLYVVVAGKAEVIRTVDGQPKTLAFLGGGAIFGEISMLTGAPLSSTVTAVTDCDVLEIERADLNKLARDFPSVPQVLAAFAQQRMARNLVASSPLFAQVPELDRAALLSQFVFKALSAGDRVIVEGEPVQALVLVLAGELVVQKEDPSGGAVSLSILREGDIAGEIALVKGLRATATVVSTRKTAVATLGRVEFEALIKQQPKIRTFLDGLSDRRLKMMGEAMRPAEILDADELVMDVEGES